MSARHASPTALNAAHDRCAAITRYWNDPAYRAEVDATRDANRSKANAAIDESLARYFARRRAR